MIRSFNPKEVKNKNKFSFDFYFKIKLILIFYSFRIHFYMLNSGIFHKCIDIRPYSWHSMCCYSMPRKGNSHSTYLCMHLKCILKSSHVLRVLRFLITRDLFHNVSWDLRWQWTLERKLTAHAVGAHFPCGAYVVYTSWKNSSKLSWLIFKDVMLFKTLTSRTVVPIAADLGFNSDENNYAKRD